MSTDNKNKLPSESSDKGKSARSIKNVTFGQFFEFIDYIKKFWVLFIAVGSAIYVAVTYFATSEAVEKLDCQAERRILEERHRSSITLLEQQKEGFSNQQTSLLKLQTILLEIQISNPNVGLDLTNLKNQMKVLIDDAELEEKEKSKEIEKAKKDLKVAEATVKSCGKEK